jgi:hypothetical protein
VTTIPGASGHTFGARSFEEITLPASERRDLSAKMASEGINRSSSGADHQSKPGEIRSGLSLKNLGVL